MRKVDKAIQSLELPARFEFDQLVRRVSDRIGLAIDFLPCSMPSDITGLVIPGEMVHILFEARVSPLHQAQIRLHELGHIVLDHVDSYTADDGNQRVLESFFTSELMYKQSQTLTFMRRTYDSESEAEAELFATRLIGRLRLEPRYCDDPLLSIGLQ